MGNGFVNGALEVDTSIETPSYTTTAVPFVKYGTQSVTGDGALYLLSSSSFIGRIQLGWGGTDRDCFVELDVCVNQYGVQGYCTVVSNYSYLSHVVLTNFRLEKEGAVNYLVCDIANRNGSTENVTMIVYTASSVTFAPATPGAPVAVANRGFQCDVYGNYTFPVNVIFVGILKKSTEAITSDAAGVAASIATAITKITTDGDVNLDNVTLADGIEGQEKKFMVSAVGNVGDSVKITPANLIGGTQITFPASPLGLGCDLCFDAAVGGWGISGNHGGTMS